MKLDPAIKRVIIMRINLIAFLVSITVMNVFASASAQNISINVQQAPLKEVLNQIKKQSGYQFLYDKAQIESSKRVTINVKGAELKQVLDLCFEQQPLTYEIVNKTIVIKERSPGIINRVTDFIRRMFVSGKISNEQGEPIPGVNIKVKGKTITAISGNNGEYRIEANAGDVLVFSYVGYEPQEASLNEENKINIVLKERNGQLDQVQVIGYGTTTQRLSTGNVSVVNAATISKQPVSNPLQALIGRVAGLQITQTSGLPQSTMNVQIRGRNSILSSNEPLYIVDGVPFTNSIPSPFYQNTISPLNSINPNDIESISVLKDADATAIFGSRAANGVILITTKKGKSGKTEFIADFNTGFSDPSRTVEFMTTAQYLQIRGDAFKNSGVTPTKTNAPDLLVWDQNQDNNLQDFYLSNTAKTTNAAASISGGSSQTTFLLNGNYHRETTVRSDDEHFNRANIHLNVLHRSLNEKFQLQANTFFTSSQNYARFFNQNLASFVDLPPNYPIYNPDGTFNWSNVNAVAASKAYQKNDINNINSNLVLQYLLLPGLNIKGSLGYSRMGLDGTNVNPSYTKNPLSTAPLGNSSFINVFNQSFIFEPQASFKTSILGGTINLIVGGTLQKNNSKNVTLAVANYNSDLLLENPGFGTPSTSSGSNTEYKYISAFGRATYNYADKYLLNLNYRRDGSTRFGDGNKFGDFGSIGAGWVFSKEAIFNQLNMPWLSYGKIRASWGTTGNDGTTDYQYLSTYSNTLKYGDNLAIIPSRIANANYSWEVNRKLEVGLELGLFKDRILLNSSWYRNRSSNQLVSYPLPATTGFSGYLANLPAVVQNTGWEFELNTENIKSSGFKWDSSLNLTIPNNKLLRYSKIENSPYANTYVVGKSLNIVQRYHFLGVDPQTGNGQYQDLNGDNVFTASSSYNDQGGDYQIVGQLNPKWYGGLNNSFHYKGIQLDFFFQYTCQSGYNLFSSYYASIKGGTQQNGWSDFMGYWKQPGDVTRIPKPVYADFADEQYQFSDAGFGNASFLRLKNVSLTYTLPESIVRHLKLSNVRLYAQGQNLWTKTKFKGYDPEMSGGNSVFQGTTVPTLRSFTFGLICSL